MKKQASKQAWSYFHYNSSWCFGALMFSRLGACWGTVLVLWSRGPLSWLTVRPALVKMPLPVVKGGVWCKQLPSPLMVLYCSLKSHMLVGRGEGWKMVLPHPLIQGKRTHTHYCSGSPQRKVNNLPFCVPAFHQIPALNLSVSRPKACSTPQFVFYLWCTAGIQISKS